ncbi:MAG: DNA repair protein RecN [Anaerolineales bacterium]|nr:DNA repair protein RecN [Anaerolineales bacterium]
MLLELRIKNFAIIEALNLEFKPGLIILTGETGAGKSIIMGALDMLLGQRVDMTTLRKGSEFASVEAVFKIPQSVKAPIIQLLEKEEILEGSDYVTLTRELRKDKRNTARVNGHRTNVGVLVELGEYLVDIHGQSEHLSLMRVNQHLGLLDRFSDTTDLLSKYQGVYSKLKVIQAELNRLRQSDLEGEKKKELLVFQVDEIEQAGLEEGEEQNLVDRRTRLANAEKLADLSQNILILLDDAPGHQPTVMDLLGQIVSSVEDLSKTDPGLAALNDKTGELSEGLFEVGKDLRSYLESLEFDPDELENVQGRLELIRDLQRKYGDTIPEIIAYQNRSQKELSEITGRGDRIKELEGLESRLLEELSRRGNELSRGRKQGALVLASELETQLNDLKMAGSRFEVDFKFREDPRGVLIEEGQRIAYYSDGLEKVEFLIETNPGEGFKPLAKTASGGETARLMLAIKNVLAQADHISTLVFDEIDQGIGGRIGAVVGEKLYRLTAKHQVFCITHLPQLAGFGQQHYQVSKDVDGGRSYIQVQEISGEERIRELATMLGGPSEKNLESARELLDYVSKVIGRN